MNRKNSSKIIVAILVIMGFVILNLFTQSNNLNTVNAADNKGKNNADISNSDTGVLLDKIYQKIKQSGYTEDTLASFAKVEAVIYKKGANNTLVDVERCYCAYIFNLISLNKQKEAGPIMNRWNTAFESVYQSTQDVTRDFATGLLSDSNEIFYTGILLGTEYDPLLLKHTLNLADFFEKKMDADPDLSRFNLQNALESLSYALLYNRKFEDFGKTVSKMLSVEDQITGVLPEDIMPIAAYRYLLEGNYQKCEEIINNYVTMLGSTKINQLYPQTGTNVVINDLYQMKKRNIESKNIDRILEKLPEPILIITGVTANGPADKSGVYKGDQINKYQGVKCLSYYHFMDLIAAHAGDSKIELELIRDNKTIALTVPGGRLGISIAEDVKK
jgi:hypothetical protein